MIVRSRVAVLSYIHSFLQSYINYYATGQITTDGYLKICMERLLYFFDMHPPV